MLILNMCCWGFSCFFFNKVAEVIYIFKTTLKLCIKKGSKGIVQTTWYAPEMSKPYFTYSIAKQWNFDADICETIINEFLSNF